MAGSIIEDAAVSERGLSGLGRPIGIHAKSVSVIVSDGRHRKTLLEDITVNIPTGDFVGIIGPSGCGKSTLLRVLTGMQRIDSGELLVAGFPVATIKSEFPLALGYLPQFGAFHEDLRVSEILDFAAALRLPKSVQSEVRKKWVDHVVELAGLASVLGQQYKTLSGGQMRRIALAEELIGDPPFLFLDELTSGLDPHAEEEMMEWLASLAHKTGKTVVLVTHAVKNIHLCDAILFLHEGRVLHYGGYRSLLLSQEATSIEDVYRRPQIDVSKTGILATDALRPAPQNLQTAKPPNGLEQINVLLKRQLILLGRERGQLWLHLILLITFPMLVAIFATNGLPQVRNLSLSIEKNVLHTLTEQLLYLKESFRAASLISGLAMFQVILLTLMGANNGAREIAKERGVLNKELRAGLSAGAYVSVKALIIALFSLIQALWMTWFVKVVCGFPGSFSSQFLVLWAATLAMSLTCLAISAGSASPERASLLAIYLVGLQLPLSGAVLALPEVVTWLTRPIISAYWGWSGYLKTLEEFRHYDVVKEATRTFVADYGLSVSVLGVHVVAALAVAILFVSRKKMI